MIIFHATLFYSRFIILVDIVFQSYLVLRNRRFLLSFIICLSFYCCFPILVDFTFLSFIIYLSSFWYFVLFVYFVLFWSFLAFLIFWCRFLPLFLSFLSPSLLLLPCRFPLWCLMVTLGVLLAAHPLNKCL